jgi:superfamily II helicase
MQQEDFKQIFESVARRIEEILRGQAPSANLAGAVQVVYEEGNGFIISLDDNAKYGIYLWRGTRDEIASGAVAGTDSDSIQSTYEAIWDRKPDLNPGKGTKGIKPRYWLNLIAADIDELQNEIDKAITDAQDKQLEKTN